MRKLELAAVIGIIGAICFADFSEFADRVAHLREEVLRLHILADSDDPEDQALKLKVRDTLLEHADTLFAGCDSPEEIRERAVEKSETIRLLAQSVLEENGCTDRVTVQLVQMDFDEKQYEQITMPAGHYDALRILIGEAEGQNWWCVMYPPLCIPAGTGVSADLAETEDFFDPETADLLEHSAKFEVRFKCLEWIESIRSYFVKETEA